MIIYSGTGNGKYAAKVDNENRLKTLAHSMNFDRHSNEEGKYWTVYAAVTSIVGAGDYFFYLKNTGEKDLLITDIRVSSTAATKLIYEHVSGTPTYVGATSVTPTNNQLGNSKAPDATVNWDTNITGLTSEGVLGFEKCATADTLYHLRKSSGYIIPQGQAFAIQRVAASGDIDLWVSLTEDGET
jgi:hypothetical protein